MFEKLVVSLTVQKTTRRLVVSKNKKHIQKHASAKAGRLDPKEKRYLWKKMPGEMKNCPDISHHEQQICSIQPIERVTMLQQLTELRIE